MIRDDYAGCGGWSEGLRLIGLSDVGYEVMPEAIATRTAAGHDTIPADLSTAPDPTGPLDGYVASPPCQTFSAAGKGDGTAVLPELVAAVHRGDFAYPVDEKTAHVLRVARVCETVNADWIALEQVPPVLPVWEAIGHRLRRRAYSVWCGVLCAADFGVPQTRRRAFLMASRSRVVHPPVPTHAEAPEAGLFGTLRPWVSMAEALGWDESSTVEHQRGAGMAEWHGGRSVVGARRLAPTVTSGTHRRWLVERQANGAARHASQPAMTITGSADNGNFRWLDRRQQSDGVPVRMVGSAEPAPTLTVEGGAKGVWCWREAEGTEPIRLTIDEALTLQSFRADYPLQGSKSAQFLQVGNAVPPLLAAHVCATLTGRTL